MQPLQICRECDTVYAPVRLRRGEVARCRRCRGVLARHPSLDVDASLAIALACAILFLIANFTPMLGVEVAGTRTQANIWHAVLSMTEGWICFAALALLVTTLVAPLVQVLLVIWLMMFARRHRRAPGFAVTLTLLHHLRPWSMSEVFLLGVLVAIVKLSHFLPIQIGSGVWALALLTVLLAVLGRLDPAAWWSLGETTSP